MAVAKAEAEAAAAAKLAAADEGKNNGVEAEDPSWRLPIDVDYYTDRGLCLCFFFMHGGVLCTVIFFI